jgi:penicillin-binding protein 1A
LITKLVKRTSAYKQLNTKGYSEQQIMDSLGRKKTMILADGEGEKTVEASTIDSIQHYKSINTIAVKVL